MANKNPYSFLNPERRIFELHPEWGKNIQRFIKDKPVVPVQIRIFVDGFNFYLNCQREAKRKSEYVKSLYENYSKKPAPETPIDAKILAEIGRWCLVMAQIDITDKLIGIGTNNDQSLISASEINIAAHQIPIRAKMKISYDSEREKRISEATAIIDPYYIVDIFSGDFPNIPLIQWVLKKNLKDYCGPDNDPQSLLLKENIELLHEGKYKNDKGDVRNINEYEQFIQLIESNRDLDESHRAKTRFNIGGHGGVYLSEKGVDAKLILGMLEAKDAPETDIICLFSNDSDYYPILEHIKENSDIPTFLAVQNEYKFVSKALKETVGEENIIEIISTVMPWGDINESQEFDRLQYEEMVHESHREYEAAMERMEIQMKEYIRIQSGDAKESTD